MCRCYGCSLPDDPPNGHWDCDILQNGDTVCMLQCEVSVRNIIKYYYTHEHTFVYRLDSPLKENT